MLTTRKKINKKMIYKEGSNMVNIKLYLEKGLEPKFSALYTGAIVLQRIQYMLMHKSNQSFFFLNSGLVRDFSNILISLNVTDTFAKFNTN